MKVVNGLGVQSFCFRGYKTHPEVIQAVKDIGVNAIEICAVHVDFKDPSTFDDAIAQYREAGVEIVSTGVNGIANDREAADKLFQFSKKAGTQYMAVNFNIGATPDCFRIAEELAEEYDIRLAIHNHGGKHWLGNTQTLANVLEKTNDRIGICLDTAWALHSHEDPIAMMEKFAGRIYGVHIKDFTFDTAGQHEDVVVGTGNLDLNALGAAMDSTDFEGYCVLEYEGDVTNPKPALRDCVAQVRNAIPALFE